MYGLLNAQLPMTFSGAKSHFCCLKLRDTHNSGNAACFNYSVFIHKLESAHSFWFKLYCQRWRTSQGHRQSRTL